MDRVFRNLLIDSSGNTHRAEFCIDKLYSPDSSSGRLGLVELRAFEMPPHARMSLAQQLLLRSLVARFWKSPRQEKLVRWGTRLHDRFMLPHFVEQDFRDVLDDFREPAIRSSRNGSRRIWNFVSRSAAASPIKASIWKSARRLEPWHVLGEDTTAGGAVRYVDSRWNASRSKCAA